MVEFFQSTASALTYKAHLILAAFAAITVLAWMKAGGGALKWSPNLRRSGAVNVTLVVFNALTMFIPLGVAMWLLSVLQNLPHLPADVWQDTPWIVRAVVALLVFDLANYAMHRLCHASAWLWPLHAVHHSDTDLHFLSANRAHILEWVLLIPTSAGAAFLCGLSIADVALLGAMREFHQYYVHSKLDWSHGPLRYVIAGPRFHRWHHVDQPEAYNKNFAVFFPFIDLIFGTYHMPGPAKSLATGFDGNPGESVHQLLLFPFREWMRLARKA